MTDEPATPGWYVAFKRPGKVCCFERLEEGWRGFLGPLPPGWTLGPKLSDLMRDAARYRWLRSVFNGVMTIGEGTLSAYNAEELDSLIDAEIKRDRHPESGDV